MTRILTTFFVAALLTGCATAPTDMSTAQINERVAYLLDAGPKPLPEVERYDRAEWRGMHPTVKTADGTTVTTRGVYDDGTVRLGPTANHTTLPHELAHHYGVRDESRAECVAEHYDSTHGGGFNEVPRGWCA